MRCMSAIASMSERVRHALKSSGLSYREIGRRVNLSNDTVRKFALTGSAKVDTVAKLESLFPADSSANVASEIDHA